MLTMMCPFPSVSRTLSFRILIRGGLSLDPQQLSFFVVISSEKNLGVYKMNTYMGFGSGGFAPSDTLAATDTTTTGTKAGVFAGFLLNTPI